MRIDLRLKSNKNPSTDTEREEVLEAKQRRIQELRDKVTKIEQELRQFPSDASEAPSDLQERSNEETSKVEATEPGASGRKRERRSRDCWPHNGFTVHRHRIIDGKFVFYVRQNAPGARKTTIRTGIDAKEGGAIHLAKAVDYVKAKLNERVNADGLVPTSLGQAYRQFVETLHGIKDETVRQYQLDGNVYKTFFGENKPVHRIKDLDVRRFLKRISEKSLRKNPDKSGHRIHVTGCKPRTKNKHIRTLNNFFAFCVANHYSKTNPAGAIPFVPVPQAKQLKRVALSYDEARKLLETARKSYPVKAGKKKVQREHREYLFRFCLIGLHTGLRESNIREMPWTWVDLDTATITIPSECFKTGVEHAIPIHPELLQYLREWKAGDNPKGNDMVIGVRLKSLLKAFKWLCDRAGIHDKNPDKTTKRCPHVLRHTVNTWIATTHGQAFAMGLLGHSPKTVSEGYTHVSLEDLRAKVNSLPSLLT